MDNPTNRPITETVATSKGRYTCIALAVVASDLANEIGSQLGAPVLLALRADASTFRNPVGSVIGSRSQKQVGWVAAHRIVTVVADQHSFGNRPGAYGVCEAMSFLFAVAHTKTAVETVVKRHLPFPALFRATFFDMAPEASDIRWCDLHRLRSLRQDAIGLFIQSALRLGVGRCIPDELIIEIHRIFLELAVELDVLVHRGILLCSGDNFVHERIIGDNYVRVKRLGGRVRNSFVEPQHRLRGRVAGQGVS